VVSFWSMLGLDYYSKQGWFQATQGLVLSSGLSSDRLFDLWSLWALFSPL
jgi:hypothetical protein